MADLATLGIRVHTGDIKEGSAALSDLTSKGKQAEAQAARVGSAAAAAGTKAGAFGNQMRSAGGHTANLTAQLNDIGVMMAAGQNPLQLALQQGTQINQVFAQMGGGGGALRAVGTAFMSMLSPVNLATIGIIAFGGAAVNWLTKSGEEARELVDIVDDLRRAMEDAEDATSRLEMDLSLRRARLEVVAMVDSLDRYTQTTAFSSGVRELMRTMGITLGQANQLSHMLGQVQNARGPDEILTTMESARDEAIRLAGGIDNMDQSQLDFVAGLESAISAMGELQGQSADVARNLTAAAIAASRTYQSSGRGSFQRTGVASGGRFDMGSEFDPSADIISQADILLGLKDGPKQQSGVAGVDERARDAARVFESTRTAAEKYAAELADLSELEQMGYIDADTHARAVDALGEQFSTGADLADKFGSSIASLGADMVLNLGNGENAVESLLDSLARLALNTVFQEFVAPGLTSAFQGILPAPAIDGARANGGPVSGGSTYLVGEQGPELFTPGASGSITPNSALGGETTLQVNIVNNTGAQVTATQGGNGRLDVSIDQQVASSIRSGPQTRRAMADTFGSRKVTA